MHTLKECTRTKLHTVVNPGNSFMSDPDLEHHFRTLARREEGIGQQAHAEYLKYRAPGSRGFADFHFAESVRLHRLADEQAEMHRPVLQAPKQISDTRISRGLEQVSIAGACIVDGSDGRTYIAEYSIYGHINIMRGDMKFSQETIHPNDPRYAMALELFA